MFFTIGISILIFVCMYFTILLILRATRSEKSNCSKINLNDHNDKSFSQFGQDLFVLKNRKGLCTFEELANLSLNQGLHCSLSRL